MNKDAEIYTGYYVYDTEDKKYMNYQGYGEKYLANAHLFPTKEYAEQWISECDEPSRYVLREGVAEITVYFE